MSHSIKRARTSTVFANSCQRGRSPELDISIARRGDSHLRGRFSKTSLMQRVRAITRRINGQLDARVNHAARTTIIREIFIVNSTCASRNLVALVKFCRVKTYGGDSSMPRILRHRSPPDCVSRSRDASAFERVSTRLVLRRSSRGTTSPPARARIQLSGSARAICNVISADLPRVFLLRFTEAAPIVRSDTSARN